LIHDRAFPLNFDPSILTPYLPDLAEGARLTALACLLSMAGGLLLGLLRARLPLREIHASCSAPAPVGDPRAARFGFGSSGRRLTSQEKVMALKIALLPTS
jgi:hypothetical protein